MVQLLLLLFFFFFLSFFEDEPSASGCAPPSFAAGSAATSSFKADLTSVAEDLKFNNAQPKTEVINQRRGIRHPEKGYLLSLGIKDDLERGLKVGDDVPDVLDTDRDTYEVRGDTRGELLGLG
jgi:hypothetical protein